MPSEIRIIIDKSLFQSMPKEAFTPLDRHFEVIIPPILIKEILGDLATPNKTDTVNFVANLANRFGVNSIVCPPFNQILERSLSGGEVEMDGRILAAGMTAVRTESGKYGLKVSQTPEDIAISEWKNSSFSVEEALWAYRWQKIRKFISIKLYQDSLAKIGISIPKPKNLKHLEEIVNEILNNPKAQGRLISLFVRVFNVSPELEKRAVVRWSQAKRPLLKDFAPYAAYCMKANLLLAVGSLNESLLGKQDKNDLRDLEYCYYLPFCEAFASNDKLLRKLVQLLKRDNQVFVGNELREDLERLGVQWKAFSKQEKIDYHFKYGSKPAPYPDSIIEKIWNELRPDYDAGKRIIPQQDSNSQNFGFREFLMSKADELKKNVPTSEESEEPSFLYYSRYETRERLQELFPHIDFDKVKNE